MQMPGKQFKKFVRWIGYDLGISPNQITIGRLLFFAPGWFLWVYMHELGELLGIWWQVIGLFALLLVTTVIMFDIVDGALARETGQVSQHGKVLDPAVDKLITYSTLILFLSAINHTALAILFALDIASTFLRGAQVQGANEFGKKKALSQNLSKLFFGIAILSNVPQFNVIGNLLIWTALVLASISVAIRVIPDKAKHPICLLIPQLLTLSNLICGLLTIWYASQGRLKTGVLLNFAAMAFDLIDGAVARRLGVTSKFGKHFDTIADLISFGLAPAALVAAVSGWAIESMIGGLLYFIAICFRLYDYSKTKDITPSGFFRGLPCPAGAWLVSSSILCVSPSVGIIIEITAAILMCSFNIYWQHFNRILPTMRITEMLSSLSLGLIPTVLINPIGFLIGPIFIYIISPFWRKPRIQTA
tara:strand:+ start:1828 stop:3081 length:1254 start_codon:yes stop_codon:yes gene_type:complete